VEVEPLFEGGGGGGRRPRGGGGVGGGGGGGGGRGRGVGGGAWGERGGRGAWSLRLGGEEGCRMCGAGICGEGRNGGECGAEGRSHRQGLLRGIGHGAWRLFARGDRRERWGSGGCVETSLSPGQSRKSESFPPGGAAERAECHSRCGPAVGYGEDGRAVRRAPGPAACPNEPSCSLPLRERAPRCYLVSYYYYY